MGGKIAMHFALHHCEFVEKLIVSDIAPKKYPPANDGVLEGLLAVNFEKIKTRKEAEEILSTYITDFGTKQFLLKNLYWKEEGKLAWRFNLKVLSEKRNIIGDSFTIENKMCAKPTLFLRGEKSKYIADEDLYKIRKLFPCTELKTILGAGHWIHADKPKEFFEEVMKFIGA
jgi:pimeloyl-ACP methyl ester carboxylesterase